MSVAWEVAGRQRCYSDGSHTEATNSARIWWRGCPSASCWGKNTCSKFCVKLLQLLNADIAPTFCVRGTFTDTQNSKTNFSLAGTEKMSDNIYQKINIMNLLVALNWTVRTLNLWLSWLITQVLRKSCKKVFSCTIGVETKLLRILHFHK